VNAERAKGSEPTPLRCPNCGQPMLLVRKTQRLGELPDQHMFECRPCGVSYMSGAQRRDTATLTARATVLDATD
jgi:hypothetical protein